MVPMTAPVSFDFVFGILCSCTRSVRASVGERIITCASRVGAMVLLAFSATAALAAPYAYIASGSSNGTVTIVDTATNAVVGSPIAVGHVPGGVAVSPDGHRVYVANANNDASLPAGTKGTVSILNTTSNTVIATVTVGAQPAAIAVSPDSQTVYVSNTGEWTVSVIDASSNTVSRTLGVLESPLGIAIAPDGRYAYVALAYRGPIDMCPCFVAVAVIDTRTGITLANIPLSARPDGIALSHDGRFAYVTGAMVPAVAIIDTITGTTVGSIPVGASPIGVATSPDGQSMYVANGGANTVSVIATASNTVAATIPVGKGPYGIAVTPDGKSIYTTNKGDGTVSVIDVATQMVSTLPGIVGAQSFGNFIGPITASALENPQPGSFQSGIGLISGWSCIGGNVGIGIDGSLPIPVPYGSARGDTASVCGAANTHTGFGLLTNFNVLGSGRHLAQLFVNGIAQTPIPFYVTAPAGEFLSGASRDVTVNDFPAPGKTTVLTWQQSQQNFAIKSVGP